MTPLSAAAAPAPGAPDGAMGRAEVLAGSIRVAGSETTRGTKRLLETIADLGLEHRGSSFESTFESGRAIRSRRINSP